MTHAYSTESLTERLQALGLPFAELFARFLNRLDVGLASLTVALVGIAR